MVGVWYAPGSKHGAVMDAPEIFPPRVVEPSLRFERTASGMPYAEVYQPSPAVDAYVGDKITPAQYAIWIAEEEVLNDQLRAAAYKHVPKWRGWLGKALGVFST